jgi:hypothetical protein
MSDSCSSAARLAWAGILLMGAASATCQAQTNPFERGPDPTSSLLNASAGPLATASVAVASPTGFGGGTIYYPTAPIPMASLPCAPVSRAPRALWLGWAAAWHRMGSWWSR